MTFTVSHLDSWLARHYSDAECAILRPAMLAVVADDKAYWFGRGWHAVYDTLPRHVRDAADYASQQAETRHAATCLVCA